MQADGQLRRHTPASPVFLVRRCDPDLLKELARVKLVLVRSGMLMLLEYHGLDYYARAGIREVLGALMQQEQQ